MGCSREALNTSTDFLARRPFVTAIERTRRKNTAWKIEKDDYAIDIDDAITECDVDLLEWLIRHGNPKRLNDGKVAFAFSLYDAASALGQGRSRIKSRIRRRMKTIIKVRDGDWTVEAQMFGPTLSNAKSGRYVVTLTAEFVKLLEHGLLIYYADRVDDILPIASPIVRRVVRRTLSHDRRPPESIENILDDICVGQNAANKDSRRILRKRAYDDIVAAEDYLTGVFDIRFTKLTGGRVGLQYERDPKDRRIWVKRHEPNTRDLQRELSGPAAEHAGPAA